MREQLAYMGKETGQRMEKLEKEKEALLEFAETAVKK